MKVSKYSPQKKRPDISPGDLVFVAGEISTFNDVYGQYIQHLISQPILGLVISRLPNFAILFINEQPHLEKFKYASVRLDSDVLKVVKATQRM